MGLDQNIDIRAQHRALADDINESNEEDRVPNKERHRLGQSSATRRTTFSVINAQKMSLK